MDIANVEKIEYRQEASFIGLLATIVVQSLFQIFEPHQHGADIAGPGLQLPPVFCKFYHSRSDRGPFYDAAISSPAKAFLRDVDLPCSVRR